jgi:oligosaccharide repeat unit polymerase
MTPFQVFSLFGILVFAGALAGALRYRTPLNPLTSFSLIDVGIFILFSGVGAQFFQLDPPYASEVVVKTAWISIVYFAGGVAPYWIKNRPFQRMYEKILHRLRLDTLVMPDRFSPLVMAILVAGGLLSYVALAVVGGGGMLWLTNTREAYITYRSGAGLFWLLVQWFIVAATLYYFWTRRPKRVKLLLAVGLACIASFLTGSKNNVLIIIVLAATYYHFLIRRISVATFALLFAGLAVSMFALMVLQGSYASLAESLSYFGSGGYFDTTAQIVGRMSEFGFQYGKGYLSSLWFYVPRSLYPGKPYEYGAILFYGTLFPGSAEQGYTPGYLAWTLDYMDFGIIGVFLSGLVRGIFQRAIFDYFLSNKNKFFAFMAVLQFSLLPVFVSMSLAVIIVWSIGLLNLFYLVKKAASDNMSIGRS